MPRATVTTLGQTVEINDVRSITVSDVTDDGDGGFIRTLRIFGEAQGANPVAALEIRVRTSNEQRDIEVTTPELKF